MWVVSPPVFVSSLLLGGKYVSRIGSRVANVDEGSGVRRCFNFLILAVSVRSR